MMSKIHPAEKQKCITASPKKPTTNQEEEEEEEEAAAGGPSVLTVWKRSSMSFQGTDGFTVFDNRGRLVFRVDNYTRRSWSVGGGGLLLMDGSGKALLTMKPQTQVQYSLCRKQHQWSAYRGGEEEAEACPIIISSRPPAFTMRKPTTNSLLNMIRRRRRSDDEHPICEAEVFLGREGEGNTRKGWLGEPDFKCEGSFRRRNCKISVAKTGQAVANISRKRINTTSLLLNDDVFTLTVQPGFDPALVMAFLIILDRISSSNTSTYAPFMCSY